MIIHQLPLVYLCLVGVFGAFGDAGQTAGLFVKLQSGSFEAQAIPHRSDYAEFWI